MSKGYVTQITSSTAFDLNGTHVSLNDSTSVSIKTKKTTVATGLALPLKISIGQVVEVTGELNRKTNSLAAVKILLSESVAAQVSGVGIIDALPDPGSIAIKDHFDRIVRADGYTFLVPAKADLTFAPPLTATSALSTNLWIRYRGTQRADGVVVIDQADFSPNTVEHKEDDLRQKSEYDPESVDPDDAQSGLSKHVIGLKVKRLPPYKDEAMQARISRVGAGLVPVYQRNLPETDPTRIDFRFHLVDLPKRKDSISLDSGIILVPRQVVERLTEDSQLAAVLADSIAEAIEKQDYRGRPTQHKLTAADWAGTAAGIVIPGAGIATGLTGYGVEKRIISRQRQQSGRVSLCLMHDAGYDVDQAPKAWWILHTKEGRELTASSMPDHTFYLYEDLGTTWRGLTQQPE